MQRTESEGVIISCDFCGSDWNPYDESPTNPMVEGHHGSVMCLNCLKLALENMNEPAGEYACTMCLQNVKLPRWFHPAPIPSPGLNPSAIACRPCIRQAAGRFNKDPDVDWKWHPKSD